MDRRQPVVGKYLLASVVMKYHSTLLGLGWPMLRLSPLTSSTSKNANHPLNSNSHNAHICVIYPTHNLSYHVYVVKLRPARYARARTCACVEQVH